MAGEIFDRASAHAALDALIDEAAAHGRAPSAGSLWAFFGALGGGVIADTLESDARLAMGDPAPGGDRAEQAELARVFHLQVLFQLLLLARPVMPPAFNSGAVARDVHEMLPSSAGGAPLILKPRTVASAADLKAFARRRFVLGVLALAAQTGSSVAATRDAIASMGESTWKDWQRAVPQDERRAAVTGSAPAKAELRALYGLASGQSLKG